MSLIKGLKNIYSAVGQSNSANIRRRNTRSNSIAQLAVMRLEDRCTPADLTGLAISVMSPPQAFDYLDTLTLSGYVSEPDGSKLTGTVDYGDGSGPRNLAIDNSGNFSLDHNWTQPGSYQISLAIESDSGRFGELTLLVDAGNHDSNQIGMLSGSMLSATNASTISFDSGTLELTYFGEVFSRTISFSDTGSNGPWSGTIDFGDGSTPQALVIDPTSRTLSFSHVYPNTGVYKAEISLSNGTTTTSGSLFVGVLQSELPGPYFEVPDQELSEGSSFSQTVEIFLSSYSASMHHVWVDYGDGSSLEYFTTDSPFFELSRFFPQDSSDMPEGLFEARVVIIDTYGLYAEADFRVLVHNVAPVFDLGPNITIESGESLARLISFVDPGADSPWTGSIDFGDGSGLQTLSIDSNNKTFAFAHVYSTPGTYTITARVYDDDDFGSDSLVVTVLEAAPQNQAPVISAPNGEIYEGSTFNAIATFVDDAVTSGPYLVSIDYGNGSPPVTFTTSDTSIDLTRFYAQDSSDMPGGVFTGTISVTDELGATGTTTFNVLVHNVPPQFDLGPTIVVNPGDSISRQITFSDPGADQPWTGVVDFGDGSGSSALVVDSNNKTFLLEHVYQTPGVYVVNATVFDDDSFGQGTVTILVNAPPAVQAPNAEINEGDFFTQVATFQDDPVTSGPYLVVIDYGNGAPPVTLTTTNNSIPLHHLYPQDSSDMPGGVFTGTISVTDEMGLTGTTTFSVLVHNVAPQFDLGPTVYISPGDTFALTVPFIDPGADQPWTGYIDFGDGNGPQALAVDSDNKTFAFSHTFLQAGTYLVQARVFDDDTFGDGFVTIVVQQSEVPGPGVSLNDGEIFEGSVYSTPVTIFPGSESSNIYTVTVSYGNGAPSSTFTVTGTSFQLQHLYPQDSSDMPDGVFQGTITVTSDLGATGITNFSVLVHNVAPQFDLGPDLTLAVGESIGSLVSFTDPGADSPWTGTIIWSDGHGSGILPVDSNNKTFAFERLFDTPGVYNLTIRVFDDDTFGEDSLTITVLAPPPPPPVNLPPVIVAPNGVINEGSVFSAIATFSDDALSSGGPYLVAIDFGNGSPIVSFTTHNNTFQLQHLFPQDSSDMAGGVFTGTISVTDNLGATGTTTFTVLVHNVAPQFDLGPNLTLAVGESIGSLVSFTDPGADSPWTGTIIWSDGHGSGVLPVDSNNKTFAFERLFDTPGVYNLTIRVFDDDTFGEDSLTITVLAPPPPPPVNLPPVIVAPNGVINEGSVFSAIATFSDDALSAGGPYLVAIDFGNGSPIVSFTTHSNSFPLLQFFPQDSSDMAGGVFTGTISVTDNLGATGTTTFTILVHNVPPVVDAGPDINFAGGGTVTRQAFFTDPGADQPWRVVVDYGDGTVATFTTFDKNFPLTHSYNAVGTFTVTVTVFDDDSFGVDTFLVTITEKPSVVPPFWPFLPPENPITPPFIQPVPFLPPAGGPAFMPLLPVAQTQIGFNNDLRWVYWGDRNHPPVPYISDRTINEGDTLIYQGYFTDPDVEDSHIGFVDYGEGRGWEPLPLNADKTFTLNNLYEQDGIYIVRVKIIDSKGAVGIDEMRVTVNNVPPDVKIDGARKCKSSLKAKVDEEVKASGSFSDPGADSWTATVDYGDGSPEEELALSGKSFSLAHVYKKPGTYTITVTVFDGKHYGKATITVKVTGAAKAADSPLPVDQIDIDQIMEELGEDGGLLDNIEEVSDELTTASACIGGLAALAFFGASTRRNDKRQNAEKNKSNQEEPCPDSDYLDALDEALAKYAVSLN